MPRDQELETVRRGERKKITLNAVDDITFYVRSGKVAVIIAPETDCPATLQGAIYIKGQGETRKPLTDYSPSGNRHVWLEGISVAPATVVVSHA